MNQCRGVMAYAAVICEVRVASTDRSVFSLWAEHSDLVKERFRGGAAGYLEFLTNETNAFNAELGLTQARLNELVSLVDIYRNLGGGWDQ